MFYGPHPSLCRWRLLSIIPLPLHNTRILLVTSCHPLYFLYTSVVLVITPCYTFRYEDLKLRTTDEKEHQCLSFSVIYLSQYNLFQVNPFTLKFHNFLQVNSIPLCPHTTIYLCIHILKDSLLVSIFWLLWIGGSEHCWASICGVDYQFLWKCAKERYSLAIW